MRFYKAIVGNVQRIFLVESKEEAIEIMKKEFPKDFIKVKEIEIQTFEYRFTKRVD